MVEGAGPQTLSGIKGNWVPLYRQFLSSPNFDAWFAVRKQEADQKLRVIHLDLLCKSVRSHDTMAWFVMFLLLKDVFFWMKDKQEIEIVDFLLQVKSCLVRE
jgi:hypothetical protein